MRYTVDKGAGRLACWGQRCWGSAGRLLIWIFAGTRSNGRGGRLAGVLGQCGSLAHLNLSRNRIRDEGAGRLAGVMGKCWSLAHLDLGWNKIGAEGAGRLAEVLGQCRSLAHLDLSHSELGKLWEKRTLHEGGREGVSLSLVSRFWSSFGLFVSTQSCGRGGRGEYSQ